MWDTCCEIQQNNVGASRCQQGVVINEMDVVALLTVQGQQALHQQSICW